MPINSAAGAGVWWLVGGLLLVSAVPLTLIIMPTNKALLDASLDKRSERAAQLLSQWGQLHSLRSLMSLLALMLFVSRLTVSGGIL
jgi:uncharacterized membrane protein